jgi:hypothetical protein
MQEPMPMSFDDFTRRLNAVFDAMAQCGEKVFVEKEGELFRLEPEQTPAHQDIWADYDPQRVKQGLKQSAGALHGADRVKLLQEIHTQRQQDSTGRPA